ncbi:hypothetical protein HYT18_01250 [Candidatus Microgenomates bacterium]|nr:hypothetical protein [Candidatus Microgenomates bacterium]
MSKISFYLISAVTFFLVMTLFLKFPQVIQAQSIPTIGDLKVGESKQITVSGLDAKEKYYWSESKVTSVILGQTNTPIFYGCFDSSDKGEIQRTIGPFSTPGLYKLVIDRSETGCTPSGNPVVSQDFSVGGPTGQSCCTAALPRYDRNKDVCADITLHNPLLPQQTIEVETECSNTNPKSYCEPESLQCFTTKTQVKAGKICFDPHEPGFDKNKHIICAKSGGQEITGCTDNKDNPGIATAIGCIHTSPVGFVKDALKFIIAISGGLAFLMMLLGAFQMLTSAGNPETLQAGRERFQSAIIGLLFVIFAVLLLRIIGVDILGLGKQFGGP